MKHDMMKEVLRGMMKKGKDSDQKPSKQTSIEIVGFTPAESEDEEVMEVEMEDNDTDDDYGFETRRLVEMMKNKKNRKSYGS